MSKIHYRFITDRCKSYIAVQDSVFSSTLKNCHQCTTKTKLRFMPPVYDGRFLTHSKSQISLEFFIFIGLAFLIAIAFSLASLDQLQDFRLERESEAVKDLALKLQKEMLIAASVEDGYVRVFEIPDKLDNIDYFLTVQNNTIIVQSKNSLYTLSIPKVIGNATKGTNKINKTGGVIYLN